MELLRDIVEQVRQNPKLVAVDDYEISVLARSTKTRRHSNGEEEDTTQKNSLWVSLRLSHRKQPGRSFVTSASKEALVHLVDRAYAAAERSEVDPWFRFPLWRQVPSSEEITEKDRHFDEALFGELLDPPAALFEGYTTTTEHVGISRKREKQFLVRSNTVQEVKYALALETDGAPLRLTTKRAKTHVAQEKRNWLKEDLGLLFSQKDAEKTSPEIKGHFILGPRVMTQILRQVKDWFLADRVQKKTSPLTEVDDRIAFLAPCLTLLDDGSLADGPYTVAFDMEGVPTQTTKIVEKGRFKSFLYDTYAATRENRLSTGNFFHTKDLRFPELCPTALYFEKGTGSNLLGELGEGLYLDFVETLDKTNPFEFWATLRGWKVTQGGLSHPVQGIHLHCDPLKLLRSAVNVGDDLQFFDRFGSPSILFEKMP